MPSHHGQFVWYELMSNEPEKALAFYRDVVGWDSADAGMPGMTYNLLKAGDLPVAGLMGLPEEACAAGAKPGWLGFVGVEDVDASAAAVMAAGGQLRREPTDIPGVGRFAVFTDPQGAPLALFKGQSEMGPSFGMGQPGHPGWHELMTSDWQAAFAFYSGLFGWRKDRGHDMGPMGMYQLFNAGGDAIGGMMTKPASVEAPPFWTYYFTVAAIEPAIERIKAGGGTVINGPMEVPGGSWIVQALDPQGVMFALVAGCK